MPDTRHDGAASGPKPRSPAEPWLPYLRPRPAARLTLFCFHHAGGAASAFRGFHEGLPDVEVAAVQLPGREARMREALVEDMTRIVPRVADALAGSMTRPFALFGHSMGALVAFELCRELRRRKAPAPVHLFASAAPAPHILDTDGTHLRSEAGLIERLRELGGVSEAVLAERELMAMVLPIFRADAAMTETRVYTEEAPLDVPITALCGTEDEKSKRADLEGWQQHTRGPFALHMVPGGHMFLQTARAEVLARIAQALG